jgi:ribosomal protein RSM22 (predicted rRNA methylase)
MAMNPALPERLTAVLDRLMEGVSRTELAARAGTISQGYRDGKPSGPTIASADDALAYAVARMPATYAVAAAVMNAVRDATPEFAPDSMLDVGAGPGTATWACREVWPGLTHATLIDSNIQFRALAESLDPDARCLARDILRDALPSAALVVASYVLAEIEASAQDELVTKLFGEASDVLILIEPGTPAGFERLRAARTLLTGQGAHILGPCTHAETCPMAAPDWCHFSQRLPRSRDHLLLKDARVPFEDERYTWLAVSRMRFRAGENRFRVLAPPVESKPGTALKLCGADGLTHRFVARRDRESFAELRRVRWGDVVVL